MCRVSSDSLRRISLQGMRTYGVLFIFADSVFSHIVLFIQQCASLTVVDHVIG